MKFFSLLLLVIFISCNQVVKPTVIPKLKSEQPKTKWIGLGIEYVNYQIDEQIDKDSIYIQLAGLDSMDLINWKNINPEILYLDFVESRISHLILDFEKFTKLKKLVLSKTGIREIPKPIGHLKNLEDLYISGSRITEFPKEICTLINLKSITIWRSKLNSLPDEIANLSNLKKLYLVENDFTKTERTKIRRLLPNCNVSFDY